MPATLRAEAPTEQLVYGSLRLGAQRSDVAGDGSGLRNYSSRLGYRIFTGLPGMGERSGAVFQAELGFRDDELEVLGDRLLLGGLKGTWGQLTYGKQWSAFYTTVGSFMDVGIEQSGFAYEGSERVAESLQYSHLFGETYVQVDAIHDDDHPSGGFDRLQAGVDHLGAVWRYTAAVSLSEGGASLRDALARRANGNDTQLCDVAGVDCVGGTIGWSVDDLTLAFGANHVRASDDHGMGAAFTVQWRPNQWSFYVEAGGFDARGTCWKALAGGLEYTVEPEVTLFAEFSVVGDGGAGSDNDHAVIGGLRIDFERYF